LSVHDENFAFATLRRAFTYPDAVAFDGTSKVTYQRFADLVMHFARKMQEFGVDRSSTVGLVVLDIGNPFFTDLARGAEATAEQHGLSVLLCSSDGSVERQARQLRFLEEQRVEGVLITPVDDGTADLAKLRARGTSVVLVDAAAPGFCSVTVDDRLGGELAGRHLLESGRSRITFVTGPESVRQTRDRGIGLRRAIDAHGAASPREVVIGTLNGAEGYAATQQVLVQRPDAVFCANDIVALGVLRGLLEAKVRVPHDIALVGYDDIEFAATAAVPLTSVRQPAAELGRTAAALLAAERDGGGGHLHEDVVFQPELVVRESTGAAGQPPGRQRAVRGRRRG
jgi:LacI family transcriptional regulator